MQTEFLISGITTGQLNAMVKNIMAQTGITDPSKAVRMLNAGRLIISVVDSGWYEKDGIIYLSLTSDGTPKEELIKRLESKGINIEYFSQNLFSSSDLTPTNGVSYKIAILKPELFIGNRLTHGLVCEEAVSRNLIALNLEASCLLSDRLSYQDISEMGLDSLDFMHEPVDSNLNDSGERGPRRLHFSGSSLSAYYVHDEGSVAAEITMRRGFAFLMQE